MFALSVDDKAKVPIGVTATIEQLPLLMHGTYEIRLPDHDFVKASKHKLTPSVYAACEIRATFKAVPEISYSGPTYVAICSIKNDSSTAYSHARDFDHVLQLKQLQSIVKHNGKVKPVAIFFFDGGPDENPRFQKTLDVAIQHFKRRKFDALVISTLVLGMSSYNQVELRMASLSKALAGLVLPHDTFGTLLDSQRRTVDLELEKRNFKKAGEVLAKVWNELMIDNFSVICKYFVDVSVGAVPYDEGWVSRHCRISQYFLKCHEIYR